MAPPAGPENYYQVLELHPTAPPEAITKSYRRLALLRHPDRNPGAKDATAVFQLLQNAYETLNDPAQRRAYDSDFFHPQHHHHRPTASNATAAAAATATAQFRAERRAQRAAATEAARQARYEAAKERKLSALRAESVEVQAQVWGLHNAIRKLEEELAGMAERDEADAEAEARREREGKDPRTWFWTFAGMAVRRGRGGVEEEEGRRRWRSTEGRHREEGRRVRVKEVEGRRREMDVLRERLEGLEERYRSALGETMEEVERAEEARVERERKEMEEMNRVWMEEEMEKARQRRQRRKEKKQQSKAASERVRKMEEERMREEKDELFEEFSERIETEETEQEFWQGESCQEAEQGLGQETREEREARHNPGQPEIFEQVICKHDSDWSKVEWEHLCSWCEVLSSQTSFRCHACLQVMCGSCHRMLRGEAKWKAFSREPDVFQSADGGAFSVF